MDERLRHHKYLLKQFNLGLCLEQTLSGGYNNNVYSAIDLNSHKRFLVKFFTNREDGIRDRMKAEIEFLTLGDQLCKDRVPKIIDYDSQHRVLITEFLNGSKIVNIRKDDIDQALKFLSSINSDSSLCSTIITQRASDSQDFISRYIEDIRKRYSLLDIGFMRSWTSLFLRAETVILAIRRLVEILEIELETNLTAGIFEDRLDEDQLIVSPSDFGFHNAIRTTRGLVFFDFEFSGWDDSLKGFYDFALQPRIPPIKYLDYMRDKLISKYYSERPELVGFLEKLFMLRWILIIVKPFCTESIRRLKRLGVLSDMKAFLNDRIETAEARIKLMEDSLNA